MIAVAQILFRDGRSSDELLEWIALTLAAETDFRVSRTEWRGYSIVVPQVLVETSPVPLTLQLEDEGYVEASVEELAEGLARRLTEQELSELRGCNARIDVMSAHQPHVHETEEAITVFASSDLDPSASDVSHVLATLVERTTGWLIDNMEGRVRPPLSRKWLDMVEE